MDQKNYRSFARYRPKGGSSMMSLLMLRETICHNVKGAFDTAFDTVWIDGLFYHLYKQGIDYKPWKLLCQYYKELQGLSVLCTYRQRTESVVYCVPWSTPGWGYGKSHCINCLLIVSWYF